MFRILGLIAVLFTVAACTQPTTDKPLADLGAFRLGHNVVVANKAQKVPSSREATEDQWVTAMTRAVEKRFAQYQGNQLYHFGISVEGYNLAAPGVPIVLAPKSVLAINVTVWDDAAGAKLNDEVKQFTIFETTTAGSATLGSGHVRTAEEQIEGLVQNAVAEIEDWLIEQRKAEGWFDPRPGAATDVVIPRPESVQEAAAETAQDG